MELMEGEMEELRLTKDDGYREEYSLVGAARSVATEAQDYEDCLRAVGEMIGAILEELPPEQAIRILNAGSRYSWRKLEDSPQ